MIHQIGLLYYLKLYKDSTSNWAWTVSQIGPR